MLSHTVSDQKVTISIPTRAPSLFQLLESRADWATTQTKTKTARGAVLSLLHFRRQCDRILAARAALLPRVTKGLIDLGLRQKSSSTTLRDKPEVRRSCFGCQELLGPAIRACIAPPNVGMRIHRWSWWKPMCRLTG